jgi:hypothetical protein
VLPLMTSSMKIVLATVLLSSATSWQIGCGLLPGAAAPTARSSPSGHLLQASVHFLFCPLGPKGSNSCLLPSSGNTGSSVPCPQLSKASHVCRGPSVSRLGLIMQCTATGLPVTQDTYGGSHTANELAEGIF